MIDIHIRKAEISDFSQLEILFLSVRQTTFFWEESQNFKIEDFKIMTEGEKIFIAEKDKIIVGFISIWESDSFIHNLFVYPQYHGLGIGKKLLNLAIELYPHPLSLKVVTYNIKACSFYESQGWKKLSTHQDSIPYHLYIYSREQIKETFKDCTLTQFT